MAQPAAAPPSVRLRLSRAMWVWALIWGLVLSGVAWVSVSGEVNELLDDSLLSAAQGLWRPVSESVAAAESSSLAPVVQTRAATPLAGLPGFPGDPPSYRIVWQLVQHVPHTQLLQASPGAPSEAFFATATAGLSDLPGWRVAGVATARAGEVFYAAQSQAERAEASTETLLALGLAMLPMALLGVWWLRRQVVEELQPLQRLSQRLDQFDPTIGGAWLGPPERAELQPVHHAIEALAHRLAQRMAHERAFSAHAAHALRTPLAGIDAQLAVALQQAPAELRPRLQQVRGAGQRLQRVLVALLGLFRSGAGVHLAPLELAELVRRLPVDGLQVQVREPSRLVADADLVSAALLNLLDNALRHGAKQVWISVPRPALLRVEDDGPGVDAARLAQLNLALRDPQPQPQPLAQAQAQAQAQFPDAGAAAPPGRLLGLGLTLAAFVARAHGGRVNLQAAARGFVVELELAPQRGQHFQDIA